MLKIATKHFIRESYALLSTVLLESEYFQPRKERARLRAGESKDKARIGLYSL